jgi:hypothetical protein
MVFTLSQSNQIIIDIFSLNHKFELLLSPQITSVDIVSIVDLLLKLWGYLQVL